MPKDVILTFSDDMPDDIMDEMERFLQFVILEEWYEIEYQNGQYQRRYLCDDCGDDITKDRYINFEGLCPECKADREDEELEHEEGSKF